MFRSLYHPRVHQTNRNLGYRRLHTQTLQSSQNSPRFTGIGVQTQEESDWPFAVQDAEEWKKLVYSLLDDASKKRDVVSIRKLEQLVGLSPLKNECPLHSSLAISYENCDSIADVERKFVQVKSVERPPERLWAALIKTRLRLGDVQGAVECFEDMKKTGIFPTHLIFVSTIDRCIEIGRLDIAREFLENVSAADFSHSQAAWIKLISAMVRTKKTSQAVDLLHRIRSLDTDYTPQTLNALLGLLAKTGQIDAMLDTFQQMRSNGHPTNTYIWSTVISALSFHNRREELEDAMFQAQVEVEPDLSLCNTMLKALGQIGDYEGATILFDRMRTQTQVRIDNMSWNIFFRILVNKKDGAGLLQYFDYLRNSNTRPNAHNWSVVILALGQFSMEDEAINLIHECLRALLPVELNETLYTGLIQTCGIIKQPGMAVRLFEKFRKTNSNPGNFISLALVKALADAGDVNGMMRAWDRMQSWEKFLNSGKPGSDVAIRTVILTYCPEDRLSEIVESAMQHIRMKVMRPDRQFWSTLRKRVGDSMADTLENSIEIRSDEELSAQEKEIVG